MVLRLLNRSFTSLLALLLVGCSGPTRQAPQNASGAGNSQSQDRPTVAEAPTHSSRFRESAQADKQQQEAPKSDAPAARSTNPPNADTTSTDTGSPVVFPTVPQDADQLRQLAQRTAEKLITAYPDSADAWEVKSRFHMLVGETDAAQQCWERALELSPGYPYALHGLGQLKLQSANFEAAVSFLEEARQGQPDSAKVVEDLSRAYTKLGEVKKATLVLQEYSSRHPEHTETLVLLGQAYQSLRQFDSAKDAYERALAISPNLPRAQQCLGTVLLRLGDRERAQALLQAQHDTRQAERLPSQAEVFRSELASYAERFVFAAQVFLGNGNIAAGQEALLIAAECDPSNQQAWSLLLDIQRQTGNLPASLAIAEKMCATNPLVASYAYTLGVLQTQAQLLDSARQSFRRVIELAPQTTAALESLILLNLRSQLHLEETLQLAKSLTSVRGSASDFDLLGQTQASLRDFDAAKRSLEKAIELAPDNQRYQKAMEQLMLFLK